MVKKKDLFSKSMQANRIGTVEWGKDVVDTSMYFGLMYKLHRLLPM